MLKKRYFYLLSLLSLVMAGCSWIIDYDSENLDDDVVEEVDVVEEEPAVVAPEPETEPPVVDTKDIVSFFAVGDNLIHTPIYKYAHLADDSYDFKPIYEELATDIAEADLAFINQESLVGDDELGFSGYPAFNTPSAMIPNLVDLGFDIVVGSNNHTLDMGTRGVNNTIELWAEHQDEILFTGIFNSQEHRDTIPVVEVNGIKFSILTYTYGTNGIVPAQPYFVNYFDRDLITEDVERAQDRFEYS